MYFISCYQLSQFLITFWGDKHLEKQAIALRMPEGNK